MTGPKGGRPVVGPQVHVAIPPDMLARIDAEARLKRVSRAKWIRRACQDALGLNDE